MNDDSIKFEIFSKDELIKTEFCDIHNSKEISFVIDTEIKMSEFNMNWEFTRLNNVKGNLDLSQIFKEFSFKFRNSIKFEINSKEHEHCGVKYFSIDYIVKNDSEKSLKNLKFFIYLYQIYDDNLIFNNQLPDNIFYEGSLNYQIKEIKGNDTAEYNLKLYPDEGENILTTCLVIDLNNQIVYMSPITKYFYIK